MSLLEKLPPAEDAPAHPPKSSTNPCEALQARSTKQASDTSRGTGATVAAGGEIEITGAALPLHLANVVQQLPLGERQLSEYTVTASAAQQGLDEGEIEHTEC